MKAWNEGEEDPIGIAGFVILVLFAAAVVGCIWLIASAYIIVFTP